MRWIKIKLEQCLWLFLFIGIIIMCLNKEYTWGIGGAVILGMWGFPKYKNEDGEEL